MFSFIRTSAWLHRLFIYTDREGPDQNACRHRLIMALVVRLRNHWISQKAPTDWKASKCFLLFGLQLDTDLWYMWTAKAQTRMRIAERLLLFGLQLDTDLWYMWTAKAQTRMRIAENTNELKSVKASSFIRTPAWYRLMISGFWQEDLLSFLYRYIGKISPAHWRPCFLTNPNGLNNLGRESPKEHFCKIILKSVSDKKIF